MGKTVAAITVTSSRSQFLFQDLIVLTDSFVFLFRTVFSIFPNDLSSVSLWSVNKKKPLSTVKQAHGCHGDAGLEQPHWVASVAALQNSDTVASGASGCESPPYQLFNYTQRHTHTLLCAN